MKPFLRTVIFLSLALGGGRLTALGATPPKGLQADKTWPQAGGPSGDWSAPKGQAPARWSVVRNENILWRTPLPEGGQGGIAVWGDRVFLTTLKPEDAAAPAGKDIVGYCLDAKSGNILWQVDLPGREKSVPAYFFSDATSPSPLTDGEHVWFFNACGSIGCFDFEGRAVWKREWVPTGGRPFNKQFEPIFFGNAIINMEPRDEGDPRREAKDPWNYLRGLDKKTGKTLWVSEDAMTHYNTPVLGWTAEGVPAVLQGRGAYHGVPEKPEGLSLMSLVRGHEGQTLWRLDVPKGKATYTMHWNKQWIPWIEIDASEHWIVDSRTGAVLRKRSLTEQVDWRRADPKTGKLTLLSNVNLKTEQPPQKVFPAQFCNILAGKWHWFLCYTEAKKGIGPAYCVGRVHMETDKVEYLELPVSVVREKDKPDAWIWGAPQTSSTVNMRGIDIAKDKRSQGDGWWWGYLGSPTAVGRNLYFTTMLGLTYTLNAEAETLTEEALLGVSDLGAPGQTWSLNSISYADGRLYHRSLREVVCIGNTR